MFRNESSLSALQLKRQIKIRLPISADDCKSGSECSLDGLGNV